MPLRDSRMTVIGCIAAIGRTGRVNSDDEELAGLLRTYAERIVAEIMS